MTSLYSRLASAVFLFSVVGLLVSAQAAHATCPVGNPVVVIQITYNVDGTCSQANLTHPGDQSGGFVKVDIGCTVKWVPAVGGAPFNVQFYPVSLFSDTTTNTSGPANGVSMTQYPYGSLTIASKACSNTSTLGLIMR